MEALRWARLGDLIFFYGNYSGLWPSDEAVVFKGILVDREGQLYIQSEGACISAGKTAWLGYAYGVARQYSDEHLVYLGTFYAERRYYHLKFAPNKVDWVEVGLDVGGIVADIVSLGTVGKLPDIAKIARATGKMTDLSAIAWSWPPFAIRVITEMPAGNESLGFGIDFADLLSPVPVVFDVVGLFVNLGQGVYRIP